MIFFHSDFDWICSRLFNELPFQEEEDDHVDDIDIDKENSVNSEINFDAVCSELKSISGISIAHLNVCSLLKNIDEIRLLLDEAKINILTMCETRLDGSVSDNEICIDGYNIVRNDRNRNGGGVIMYIRNTVDFKILAEYQNHDLEIICIQVNLYKEKPFILMSWYRPPDSSINVFDKLETILQDASRPKFLNTFTLEACLEKVTVISSDLSTIRKEILEKSS